MSENKQNKPAGAAEAMGAKGKQVQMKKPGTPKAKDFKGSLKRLLSYIGRMKGSLAIVIICAILATGGSILSPLILANALNAFQGKVVNNIPFNFHRIALYVAYMGAIYLLTMLFSLAHSSLMARVTQMTVFRMREDVDKKLMRLPFNYFDSKQKGDILSRVTNDIENVGNAMQQCVTQLVTSVLTIIGCIVLMCTISWQLTIICLVLLVAGMVISKRVLAVSQKNFKQQWMQLGMLNGMVEESFSGMNVIKAFRYENAKKAEFEQKNNALYGVSRKAQFLSGIINPLTGLCNNIAYIAICGVGGYLFITGRITLGGISAMIQYQKQYSNPVMQMATVLNTLQSAVASAERVFELLDEKEEVETAEKYRTLSDGAVDGKKLAGAVDFSHLQFGYVPGKLLMNDIDVHVKPGQMVAIVGPTGAGKTTLVNLLMRFYEPNGGEILVDGVPIRELTRHDLRTIFSMVLQETWLFSGTIHDNIAYGKDNVSEEEIITAAKAAQIEYFFKTMPDGYDTVINEEASNISQGQKQLLTIARAMIADPKILILDEATSSVDTRTELLIQKAMDKLLEGRTSFVIAHRLSTIKDADLILVMKDGNIVEQGSHESLLAENGLYAELYNSQFEK